MLKEIQKRLPDDIVLEDNTTFEFTEDEFVVILSWIKYFNHHYQEYGKTQFPKVVLPIISKRLILDLGLYMRDERIICLFSLNKKKPTIKDVINFDKL